MHVRSFVFMGFAVQKQPLGDLRAIYLRLMNLDHRHCTTINTNKGAAEVTIGFCWSRHWPRHRLMLILIPGCLGTGELPYNYRTGESAL